MPKTNGTKKYTPQEKAHTLRTALPKLQIRIQSIEKALEEPNLQLEERIELQEEYEEYLRLYQKGTKFMAKYVTDSGDAVEPTAGPAGSDEETSVVAIHLNGPTHIDVDSFFLQ